jgi:D-alanyl-D-alanine carboxypeptidase/D-alanyl-D-alanine-endopeptidase (penicillin-binding protein 4)
MTWPTRPPRRARGLAATAVVVALAAGAVPATASSPTAGAAPRVATGAAAPAVATATPADDRIARKLAARATTTRFGTAFSGTVIDAESNEIIWSTRRTKTLMPASNAKLFTAATALDTFGPDRRFGTYVQRGSRANHVVLVGYGDPLLKSSKIAELARATKAWLDARGYTNPRIYVDDYFFPKPSLAYGWLPSYVNEDVTPVRALVRDYRNLSDTSADAGKYFAAKLRYLGVSGARYRGRQNVTSKNPTIAKGSGRTVASMVRRMILRSDNDVAEILLRRTSYQLRNGTSWSGAKETQSEGAQNMGLTIGALYDGSGLSRADRLSSGQVVKLLRAAVTGSNPRLRTLRSKNVLPTAGRTGTLSYRFTSTASDCAVGKVWAKTGSLRDVSAISGYTVGTDGRTKIFSFIVNGKSSSSTLRNNLDMLAATVNGCY